MTPVTSTTPYYDLGKFQRKISTINHDCQVWFNRGFTWIYGFHLEEAAKCFENAISNDPSSPMPYWGLAYSTGPHYNKPWELFDKDDLMASLKKTHAAALNALENVERGTEIEQALIRAVQLRYPQDSPTDDYAKWHANYADAMRKVYQDYQDDLDVAVLTADAQMNITPWAMWDLYTGQPNPPARTFEAKAILERAMKLDNAWQHPGLLHSYIHLMEMSPQPELALTVADRLRHLIPDSGHLRHMPSHLDILVGDYRAAVSANALAMIADEKQAEFGHDHKFYMLYQLHDYHSLIYAAMFSGQTEAALDALNRMEALLPESVLRIESPPMADWTEVVVAVRYHVLIRFGRWDEIIAAPLPKDQKLYCVTTATMHYAKAIAYAAREDVEKATAERDLFEEAIKRVPSTRMEFPNKASDALAIAQAMLAGELEYRRGNIDEAFTRLQHAVDLDDKLIYSEPWAWMLPTRHSYAALLLEQGQVERAAALYRADLGLDKTLPRARQHPNNVWALHGYHECLKKLGKQEEADLLDLQLKIALAVADIEITSSCFCRLNTESAGLSTGVPDQDCCNGDKS